MAKNQKPGIARSFKFKAIKQDGKPIYNVSSTWAPIIEEYNSYYNRASQAIAGMLTMKMSEFDPYITAKISREIITSDEWKDVMLFNFLKKYRTSDQKLDIIYPYISKNNLDRYTENLFGAASTYYRKQGYIKSALANMCTKLKTVKCDVKRKELKDDEYKNEELVLLQTIYEVEHYNISSTGDFEYLLSCEKSKENKNQNRIDRLAILSAYYAKHEKDVRNKIDMLVVEKIASLSGCVRKSNQTITIGYTNNSKLKTLSVERKEGSTNYIVTYTKNGKKCTFEVLGRRDVVRKDNDRNITDLIDIAGKHGCDITFNVKKDTLFVIISATYEQESFVDGNDINDDNTICIDVNQKHSMLSTSIPAEGFTDFVNVYEHLIHYEPFMKHCTKEEKDYYADMATHVNAIPLELGLLFERYAVRKIDGVSKENNKTFKKEEAFVELLKELHKKYIAEGDKTSAQYIECLNEMRKKMLSIFSLKIGYRKAQHSYDLTKQEGDCNFADTDKGKETLDIIRGCREDLVGCRDNMIEMFHKSVVKNGYKHIGLEKLKSSQMKIKNGFPTTGSLMKYHKISGMTLDQVVDKFDGVPVKSLYEFTYDEDGKIINADYTNKTAYRILKNLFYNDMIKATRFANVKDKLLQLSFNDGHTGIGLLPPFYSSQMDSVNHCLYYEVVDGKKRIVSKNRVRGSQETYDINGMNADTNSTENLKYTLVTDEWRDIFCVKVKKRGYATPLFDATVKGSKSMIDALEGIGALKELKVD